MTTTARELPEEQIDPATAGTDPVGLLDGTRLARNSAISLIAQVLPGIVGIVCLPYLVHGLGTERFGMLSLVWLGVGYFSIFDFGLGRAVTKSVAEDLGLGLTRRAGATARVALQLLTWVGLAVGLLCLVSAVPLVERVLRVSAAGRPEAASALRLMSIAIPVVVLTTGTRGILEAAQEFTVVNLVRIPTGILTFLAPAILVRMGFGLSAIVVSLLVVRAAGFLVYLRASARIVPLKFDPNEDSRFLRGRLLRFGSWVALSNIISPMMVSADRVVIGAVLSVSAVTYYATPFEAVSKLSLIPGAISIVLFPAFSAAAAQGGERLSRLFSSGYWVVIYLLLPPVAIGALMAPELLRLWLGSDFVLRSAQITVWLSLGMLANGAAQVPFALLQGKGRSDLTAKIHMIEAPLYALLLYVLLREFGVVGAAAAWALRALLDLAALTILTSRVGEITPAAPRVAFIVAVLCTICGLAPLDVRVRGALLLVALVCSAILLMGEVSPAQLRRMVRRPAGA